MNENAGCGGSVGFGRHRIYTRDEFYGFGIERLLVRTVFARQIEDVLLVVRIGLFEIDIGRKAVQLCITAKYLSEIVKTVSRRSPNDWIDSYVSLEIRNLLRNTTMNIKEITQAMHFPNQSFLGKFFKEHVGMSPSQYRKM